MPGGDSRDGSHAPTLSAVQDELVWIDCEMTGLDLGSDKLIEIAALVTDADLNILGDGVDVVMHADDAALSGMIDVVAEMHSRSGLIDEVKASTVDLATAEAMVLDYINEHVKQPKTAPLAGNSIATDRAFIARDMPTLDSFLHYRMIDVSSIKELCRRWYPRIYFGQPPKGLTHRALADIHESIRELRFYRRTAFVPQPGPSTSEIAAVVAELSDGAGAQEENRPVAGVAIAHQHRGPTTARSMREVPATQAHSILCFDHDIAAGGQNGGSRWHRTRRREVD